MSEDRADRQVGTIERVTVPVPPPRRVAFLVAAIVAVLVLVGIFAAVVRARGSVFPGKEGIVALFHLDSEFNVPAIVSVLGLATCGVLLLLIASCLRAQSLPDAMRWKWLGVGFLYLGLDEGARIHERANNILNDVGPSLAALRFGWVLLGFAAVAVLVPIYLPAVLRLPRDLRLLALASAVLFVGGALGMEMVGAALYERGTDDAAYLTAVVIEETGEMAGVGLFVVTLWTWWGRVAARTELVHAAAVPAEPVGTSR